MKINRWKVKKEMSDWKEIKRYCVDSCKKIASDGHLFCDWCIPLTEKETRLLWEQTTDVMKSSFNTDGSFNKVEFRINESWGWIDIWVIN